MKKNDINTYLESRADDFIKVSDTVWEFAETGLIEFKSADYLCEVLQKEGFTITKGVSDMETAFIAEYKKGDGICVGILGEYDALPALSQKAASYTKEELVPDGNGHGCGHNALGAGSLAAAVGVKKYLEESDSQGTVRYYGTPGEENGAGKTFMARDGVFGGDDVALCWHPNDYNDTMSVHTQACLGVHFKFKGITAHAAASPHLGRSALDAVELMNVGANYLREHITTDCRIHYAITNTGGLAPNVVQDKGEVYYFVRAPKTKKMFEVFERLKKVAQGAALMTETELTVVFQEGLSDYIPNSTLSEIMSKNFLEIGAPKFDDDDYELAKKFMASYGQAEIDDGLRVLASATDKETAKQVENCTLNTVVPAYKEKDTLQPGSTDVGDVSYVVPTAQVTVTCCAVGTPGHSWQFTGQMGSSIAHKGMLTAAKVMAATAIDVIENPEIAKKALAEHQKNTGGEYICPVPDDLKPALHI